jgi:hypothetical protein
MDSARVYIADVMVRLGPLSGITWVLKKNYKVGSLTYAEHDRPPIIKWAYGDITHLPAEKLGDIGTELQDLEIHIWAAGIDQDESETKTRILKNQLLIAARLASQVKYLGMMSFGAFRWGEEAHERLGRWLDGTITIPLPVPNYTKTFVVIESVEAPGYLQNPAPPLHETLGCTVELESTADDVLTEDDGDVILGDDGNPLSNPQEDELAEDDGDVLEDDFGVPLDPH